MLLSFPDSLSGLFLALIGSLSFFLTSATKLHFFLGVFLHFITGADNISYGEEASCLDWVLKVISSLNSYQNQVVEEMEKLTQNLSTVDREICDELHYIEFCNLNAAEGYKSYKRLKELQQKRRAIKNSFEMLDAVQVVVSGVSKIEKMVTDPAKKSYTLREPETFIHDWRG